MNATSPAHPPSQARPEDTWKAGAGQRTTHAHTIPNRPNRAESAPRPHDITDPRIQAKKLKVIIVDDIDGTEGDGIVTHRFSLGSDFYEIDLCPQNLLSLRASLEPFVSAGRRVRRLPRSQRGSRGGAVMKKILAATAIGMNTIKKLVAGLAMAFAMLGGGFKAGSL